MEDGDDATTPLAMNPDTPTSTTSSSPTANNHDHKGNHARTSRSRSGSAASTTSNHRRNVSSSLLSKLSFLRVPNQNASPEQQGGYRNAAAVNEQGAGGHDDSANGGGNGGSGGDEGDGDGAEGDNDVPGSAPGTGVRGSKAMPSVLQQQQQQQQQQQRRTRKRRGSLRKTALLGTRLESKKLNRGAYSTATTNNNGNNNDDDGDDENDGSGQHQHGLTLRSFGDSSDTNSPRRGYISPAQQQQQQQQQQQSQKPLRGRQSSIRDDETGTDDETTSAVQRNHLGAASSSTDSYFALPTADTAAAAAVHRTKSLTHHHHPLLHHHHHTAAEINHSDIPWDYSETEWWGWIILIVTWLVFVVGMGSCFGVWSWAWDVGETPYAPPELEDDPTLPIVGYYPALIILTAVMSWVWVVVAWVGMKYFKHANISGEEI